MSETQKQPAQQAQPHRPSRSKVPALSFLDFSKKIIPFLNFIMQGFEKVWKILFGFVGIFFLILSKKVYSFRTLEYFQNQEFKPQGNVYSLLIWGGLSTIIYLVCDHFWHKRTDQWCEDHFLTEKRYLDAQSRKKRAYTISKWGFSVFYYLGSSIIGFLILRNTQYLPSYLGGSDGYTSLVGKLRNLEDASIYMEIFYFIQYGKHCARFIGHLFIRAEGSYYQYCLHHSLSLYLIVFSYCVNMWHIGIFVLVLHDYTDFSLILGRAYKDFKHRNEIALQFIYVHAVGTWILMRVIIFSMTCVYISVKQAYTYIMTDYDPVEKETLLIPYLYLAFMLSCLQFMHLYWTYYIINSAIEVHSAEKIMRHNYD